MSDLYGSLDEKKKKRKKRKKAGSESSKESSLRDWFGRKGAKGKKKGWVDCNAPDGKGGYKSCGRGSGEKRKKYPACRPTPGACKERGKGKSWGKKAKKRKNEEIHMDLEQIIKEELEAVMSEDMSASQLEDQFVKMHQANKGKMDGPMRVILQKLTKLSKQGRYHKNVQAALRKKLKSMNENMSDDDSREMQRINDELKSDLDAIGMDWIMDDENMFRVLDRLKRDSRTPDEYQQKIKLFLNKNADEFGYGGLGDEVLNESMGLAVAAGLMVAAAAGDDSDAEEVAQDIMSDEEKKRIAAELVAQLTKNQGFKDLAKRWEEEDNLKRNKPATNLGFDRKAMKPAKSLEEIVSEELEAVLDEKRKKKKKKKKKSSGKKDACYHKVKSRYKVWPSAYASGALVKCRKVGAKNWGNSKKESLQIMIEDELSQILNEKEDKYKPHDMYDPKSGEKHDAKKEKDHLDMAKKGFVHVDPKKIEQILRDEGGAAGMDPFLKEFGEEMKDEIVKALENMPNVAQHEDGDYILDDDKDVDISEGMNCGCGQDPCETYGKNNEKIIAIVNEETEKYLEESLYYGLIEEDDELLEKKKKKKACKPSKGKKYARRVKGKCVSYGAKGYKIAPGTSKGNSYCARSYGDMKSHGKDCSGKDRSTPLCLSRKKWKCSGKYSRKGK